MSFDPDHADFPRWLLDLRVALEDYHAVVRDMQRRKRRRSLGPSEHRRLARDSRKKLKALLDYAGPPPEGAPPAAPSAPVH